jgi:O-methyltransferase
MTVSVIIDEVLNDMIGMASTAPPGSFVEVGVYKGGSAVRLANVAEVQGRAIFLYDTFEGIPYTDEEKGDKHAVGDFNDTSFEEVKSNIPYATVVKGIFPDSAVPMKDIAFVHVDCDQYKSIIDTVNYLTPLMVKGGIFWFDDAPDILGARNAVTDLYDDNFSISSTGKIYKVVD